MLEKASFLSSSDEEKWAIVLCHQLTSSDESDTDDGKEIIKSHPLPWLSACVGKFKQRLDQASLNDKSPQAKRQMKQRVERELSLRPTPDKQKFPSWVFV